MRTASALIAAALFTLTLLTAPTAAATSPDTATDSKQPPHIVWVVADDLGWDDVGFTGSGSNINTPTLNALAASGTVLMNYYVQPICTPSRSAFLSGLYPIHTGLQHGVIADSVPNGLPLDLRTVADDMADLGYATHAVGKWHLGFYTPAYKPTSRGFETFYGYYTGNEDYYNHTSPCWGCGNYTAFDLHNDTATESVPVSDQFGNYSTELFTDVAVDIIASHNASQPLFLYLPYEAAHGAATCDPDCDDGNDALQAPQYYIDQQKHIINEDRRTYGGMVGALDDAVANVTQALKDAGLWENTVLLFTSDNGAPASHFNASAMSNYPLRGQKGQLWEGGVRGAAFVTGKGVPAGVRTNALLSCTDWYPTFVELGGGGSSANLSYLDGANIWDTLTTGAPSPHTHLLHNIDPLQGQAAVRSGDMKLMVGMGPAQWYPQRNVVDETYVTLADVARRLRPGSVSSRLLEVGEAVVRWLGGSGRESQQPLTQSARELREYTPPHVSSTTSYVSPLLYLYNITADPIELNNVATQHPDLVYKLLGLIAEYNATAVPVRFPPADPAAQPPPGGFWESWESSSWL